MMRPAVRERFAAGGEADREEEDGRKEASHGVASHARKLAHRPDEDRSLGPMMLLEPAAP